MLSSRCGSSFSEKAWHLPQRRGRGRLLVARLQPSGGHCTHLGARGDTESRVTHPPACRQHCPKPQAANSPLSRDSGAPVPSLSEPAPPCSSRTRSARTEKGGLRTEGPTSQRSMPSRSGLRPHSAGQSQHEWPGPSPAARHPEGLSLQGRTQLLRGQGLLPTLPEWLGRESPGRAYSPDSWQEVSPWAPKPHPSDCCPDKCVRRWPHYVGTQ